MTEKTATGMFVNMPTVDVIVVNVVPNTALRASVRESLESFPASTIPVRMLSTMSPISVPFISSSTTAFSSCG